MNKKIILKNPFDKFLVVPEKQHQNFNILCYFSYLPFTVMVKQCKAKASSLQNKKKSLYNNYMYMYCI